MSFGLAMFAFIYYILPLLKYLELERFTKVSVRNFVHANNKILFNGENECKYIFAFAAFKMF